MPDHHDLDERERRSLERRLSMLEQQDNALNQKVDRVAIEQAHAKDLTSTQFATVNKGIDLITTKVDGLRTDMTTKVDSLRNDMMLLTSEPKHTPLGRELSKDISEDRAKLKELDDYVEELKQDRDSMRGALTFARNIGGGGFLLALATLVLAALKAMHVIP